MNETKEGRIVLRHDGKGEGTVRIECTNKQAAEMTFSLLHTLREKLPKVYESVMEAIIREDLVGDMDADTLYMLELLFGGD